MSAEPPRDRNGNPFYIHIPGEKSELQEDEFKVEIPEEELPPVPIELDPLYQTSSLPLSGKESEESKEEMSASSKTRWIILGCIAFAVVLLLILYIVFVPRSPSYENLIRQASDLFAEGDYAASAELYEDALSANPESSEAKNGLLQVYSVMSESAVQNGNYDTAISYMELCFAETDLEKARELAEEYRKQKEISENEAAFDEALSYAASYASQNDHTRAAQYYWLCYQLSGDENYQKLAEEQEAYLAVPSPSPAALPSLQYDLQPGSYTGTQYLNLTCQDPSVKIYYTSDGTIPSQGSSRYTGVLQIGPEPGTYRIRAVPYSPLSVRGEEIDLVYEITSGDDAQ